MLQAKDDLNSSQTDGRASNGRQPGSTTTEHSTIVARLLEKSGEIQEDFGRLVGASTSAIRRYKRESLVPKRGAIRRALEREAKRMGEPWEEPQA